MPPRCWYLSTTRSGGPSPHRTSAWSSINSCRLAACEPGPEKCTTDSVLHMLIAKALVARARWMMRIPVARAGETSSGEMGQQKVAKSSTNEVDEAA
eukprot:589360-Lingulodinium_polyedra.AAC.1